MAQARLLLQPHVGYRPARAHEGSVISMRPISVGRPTHWTSVAGTTRSSASCLLLMPADRQIIAWHASAGGISGEMVRDLMLACVERRFSAIRAPRPVQWLSDNGSAYTAQETLKLASEAVVKILKRYYTCVQPRSDALTVLAQLPAWIDDHNECHPHSGPRLSSPREFMAAQSQLTESAT